jgi:hypothetical protein
MNKKIATFITLFVLFAFANSAFAAEPKIQLTGSTAISSTQVKLDAFYTKGDAESLNLYFYWDDLCATFANKSPMIAVKNTSGDVSYTVTVPKAGTYCYKVAGVKVNTDGTSDFIDTPSPAYKEFKTLPTTTTNNQTVTSPQVQNTGATSVGQNSANLNAFYNLGGASSGSLYFMYGAGSLTNQTNDVSVNGPSGDSAISLSSISPNTTYIYKAYIRTSYGTVSASNTVSFTTLPDSNTSTNNNPPLSNNYQYPACYYDSSCYWNGSGWVYKNTSTNNNTYPDCYYNSTCSWNGSVWVTSPNSNNNVYNNTNNYVYNPHQADYNDTPRTVTIPGTVRTLFNYVTGNTQTLETNQAPNTVVNQQDIDLLSKYENPTYRDNYVDNNSYGRTNLTGSTSSLGNFNLIGLLIFLVILALIVYFVTVVTRPKK